MGILVLLPIVFIALLVLLYALRQHKAIFPLAIGSWASAFWLNQRILANCPGDCGIRIDLVFVVPLLFLVTLMAAKEAWRRWR